ncbi:hypothetical protein JCM30760_14930 [Thiomicrorhabdus hydrogeniphila]
MPHIIIEYSADSIEKYNLPCAHKKDGLPQGMPGLVNSIFDSVANTQVVNPNNIKIRAYKADCYKLGLEQTGFIHVVCKTHTGKTEIEKQLLSQSILSALTASVKTDATQDKAILKHDVVITVEVVEMQTNSYTKAIVKADVNN